MYPDNLVIDMDAVRRDDGPFLVDLDAIIRDSARRPRPRPGSAPKMARISAVRSQGRVLLERRGHLVPLNPTHGARLAIKRAARALGR